MMVSNEEPTIHQLFDLSGKTALVTGASGWLGSSLSRALAEAGASVVVSSRNAERAQQAADALPTPGSAKHHGVELDHTQSDSLESGFQAAVESTGQIDILVNNGLDPLGKDLSNCTFDEFLQHQANTAGYFILTRQLRDHAVQRGAPGSVVLLGSMYGQVASYPDTYAGVNTASPVAYHAHKGGVIHMTRHLAAYYASDNVRVNCLSPGPFPKDSVNDTMVERLCEKLPMKRMGLPHELKGALLLLVSDAGSYITGENITVDGGWRAW